MKSIETHAETLCFCPSIQHFKSTVKEVIDMKYTKYLKFLFFILFLYLFFALNTYARDTDLYIDSESTIEPNILIIFDNSGSMADSPTWTTFCEYVYSYSYPQPTGDGIPYFNPTTVYYRKSGKWIGPYTFKSSISGVGCSSARSGLTYNGIYSGYTNAAT